MPQQEYYYPTPPEQDLFDTQLRGLGIAFKLIGFAFLYLPLLTIGYMVAAIFLQKKDSGLVWIISILLIATLVWVLVHFLKRWMRSLRRQSNPAWFLILVFCICLTCLQTPWLAFQPLDHLFTRWTWPHAFVWIAVIGIGLVTYTQYDFLKD